MMSMLIFSTEQKWSFKRNLITEKTFPSCGVEGNRMWSGSFHQQMHSKCLGFNPNYFTKIVLLKGLFKNKEPNRKSRTYALTVYSAVFQISKSWWRFSISSAQSRSNHRNYPYLCLMDLNLNYFHTFSYKFKMLFDIQIINIFEDIYI